MNNQQAIEVLSDFDKQACPNCGDTVAQLRGGYCSKCGQAIDWS